MLLSNSLIHSAILSPDGWLILTNSPAPSPPCETSAPLRERLYNTRPRSKRIPQISPKVGKKLIIKRF